MAGVITFAHLNYVKVNYIPLDCICGYSHGTLCLMLLFNYCVTVEMNYINAELRLFTSITVNYYTLKVEIRKIFIISYYEYSTFWFANSSINYLYFLIAYLYFSIFPCLSGQIIFQPMGCDHICYLSFVMLFLQTS